MKQVADGRTGYLVAVIGDAILDHLRLGRVTRMSPEDPRCPVVQVERDEFTLGGAANVAQWLAAASGVLVDFYCGRSNNKLRSLCEARKVRLRASGLSENSAVTTKERLVAIHEGSYKCLARVDQDVTEGLSVARRNDITQDIELNRPSAIVVADYDKGTFSDHNGQQLIQWLGRYAYQTDTLLVVNSKVIGRWRAVPATCLICNAEEFSRSTLSAHTSLPAQVRIVTQGAQGARAVIRENGAMVESPAPHDSVLDVTGAGDAFLAGVTLELLRLKLAAELVPPSGPFLGVDEVTRLIYVGQQWAAHCCAQLGCGEPLADLLEG